VSSPWPAEGTIDRLPEEARRLRHAEGALASHLEAHGYAEVVVPLLEREGVWSDSDAVRLVDRAGQVLGLRPDFTSSIARLVAGRLAHQGDVRLSYRGTVFRDAARGRRQRQQVGFERFGASTAAEDVEILRVARGALERLGLTPTLSVGSAAVVQQLLAHAGLAGHADTPELRRALDRRDGAALAEVLRPLLGLYGEPSRIDEAKRVLPAVTHAALERLRQVATEAGGLVDLAEVRPWSWYTGVVFSFHAPGLPRAVCAGGRYDELVGRFGPSRPAVGATFDVDALIEADATRVRAPDAPLRVALPKGRMQKAVLAALGPHAPTPEALASRALILDGARGTLQFLLVKDPDVPAYVERGAADVGIAGLDTLREREADLLEPRVLPFGRCKMCLCGRPDVRLAEIAKQRTPVVATKYPRLTQQALAARGLSAEILELQGSVELSVATGLADAIVDLVETGATLRDNGLAVVEPLFESTARVVVNRAAFRQQHAAVLSFLDLIGAE
jgi:ATP phosphoribosyltransferase regulatory subunit